MRILLVAGVALVLVACKFPPLPELPEDASVDAVPPDGGSEDATSCTQTTCASGVLEVCGASGTVEHVEPCRLGCFSNDRCRRVDPSNGLGAQLDGTSGLAAVTIPSGATVEADTGVVRSGGQVVAVATETVPQGGGPTLRVFMARSFVLGDIQIRGTMPVAIVAMEDIEVRGIIDVSADDVVAGPGALTCAGAGRGGDQPGGAWLQRRSGHVGSGQYIWTTPGAGGGGFGSTGGVGGQTSLAAGVAGGVNGNALLVPLRGGCPGGGVNSGFVDVGHAGRGGGAIQLVSGTGEIVLMATPGLAGVHAGGGGGRGCTNDGSASNPPSGAGCGTGGGGSGGGILVEAADVRFEVGAALLASGGGGGGMGGCGTVRNGQDAPPSGGTAAGGSCSMEAWGLPPAGGAGASTSAAQVGVSTEYAAAGGGGGGLGRIRVNTRDGTYAGGANLLARGSLTTGAVGTR